MDQDSVHIVAASKMPMLKPGEYELWRMRMEYYIQMVDYSLWEVIEIGNSPPITKVVEGVETVIAPSTTEEKSQRRNKPEVETLSLDDLYNNLKIYEPKFRGTSSSITNTQNVAFVSSNSTISTNGAVNAAHRVTIASSQVNIVNTSNIDNLNDVVIYDLKEMDLKWQMAMLTMWARRFLKKNKQEVNYQWECRAPRHQDNKQNEVTRRNVLVETPALTSLVSCDGLRDYHWSDQAEDRPTNFVLMNYSSTSSNSEVSNDSNCSSSCLENVKILKEQNEQLIKDLRAAKISAILIKQVAITELRRKLDVAQKHKDEIQLIVENFENSSKSLSKLHYSQIVDKCKAVLGYNAIPPPYTGDFMPPKPDLSGLEESVTEPIVSEHTSKKPVDDPSEVKDNAIKPKIVRKNNEVPLIEDWISNSKDEAESKPKNAKKTVKPSFARIEFVKSKEQAEAVNTACYVENKVLVVNPHNKTPYEIFNGTKACDDVGKARMETIPGKDYILLPLWTPDPPFS
nr:hypothetical protein [Tanacetum cinerariifolium]